MCSPFSDSVRAREIEFVAQGRRRHEVVKVPQGEVVGVGDQGAGTPRLF